MAIRARSDNLSLDVPSGADAPAARDFTEVWAHREALRQACVRMIGDSARAEDLVQETFISALQCHNRLRDDQPVAPWLKTVARRRSIDELRGRERTALMAEPPETAAITGDDPAEHVLNQELVAALRRAIAELTPRERQLLLRQASYGLSLAELAAEEATSIASVRSVLSRARQKLRGSLERDGVFGGVLGLPRYLATLRERLVRWGVQLEPTLPTMTGAGARIGEVVAAVVTAIAMLLTGGPTPDRPGDAGPLVTDLAMRAADAGGGAGVRAPSLPSADKPPQAAGGNGRPSTPSGSALGPIPGVSDQPMPFDKTTGPEKVTFEYFASSADSQTILASGGANESLTLKMLFRSDDGGTTWYRVTQPTIDDVDETTTFPGGELFIPGDFPSDPRVFSLANDSLYRSDDAGLHWKVLGPSGRHGVAAPTFGLGDDRLFVGGPPPSVWDDAKRRLEPLTLKQPTLNRQSDVALDPGFATSGAVLLTATARDVATPYSYVARCSSGGCVPRQGRMPPDSPPRFVVSRSTPGTMFAYNEYYYFARSTDGGDSWTTQPTPDGFAPFGMFAAANAVYRYGFNVDGTGAPLYRSTDGGDTWVPVGIGSAIEPGVGSMYSLPNGNLLVAQMTWGIYCSADNGATWAPSCPSS